MQLKCRATDVSRFLHDWESVLLAINKIPDEVIWSLCFLDSSKKPTL